MYIKISFKDAKLYRTENKDATYTMLPKGLGSDGSIKWADRTVTNRSEMTMNTAPITLNNVSNVLHVLCGFRPVPSKRFHLGALYDQIGHTRNETVYNLAKKSFIEYTREPMTYTTKAGEVKTVSELSTFSKAKENSFNPTKFITWDIMERYIGNKENYISFRKLLEDRVGAGITKENLVDVVKKIQSQSDEVKQEIYSFCESSKPKLGAIVRLIRDDDGGSQILSTRNRSAYTIARGICGVEKYSGFIYVPLEEFEETGFDIGGCATILDGGLVGIHSIVRSLPNEAVSILEVKNEEVAVRSY